ncbi:MAG: gliding motility-associated C-terminal domain-containing protein [Bacteroidota bacterium]|nr:gliding motility-associated C-terminal domain-containing protein [Bacteroidota bacterium]
MHPCGDKPFWDIGKNGIPTTYSGLGISGIQVSGNHTGGNLQYRAFLTNRLKQNLEADSSYCVEFHVQLNDDLLFCEWTSDDIGAYVGPDSVKTYRPWKQGIFAQVNNTSGDILNTTYWKKIKGSFLAKGDERFISIGNFSLDTTHQTPIVPNPYPTARAAHIYVDAVYLYKCTDTLFTVDLGADTLLCPGQTLTLYPEISGFQLIDTTTTYLWNTGSTDPSITISQPGDYTLEVIINKRFQAIGHIRVDYMPEAPNAPALSDTVLFCQGEPQVLQVPSLPFTSYLWNTGETSPAIEITEPGSYSVTYGNRCWSITENTWAGYRECGLNVFVPTAFSPDGDGLNETFTIVGAPSPIRLTIFNRWGTMVYRSDNYANDWQGTWKGEPLAPGYYSYHLQYQRSEGAGWQQVYGKVMVIR